MIRKIVSRQKSNKARQKRTNDAVHATSISNGPNDGRTACGQRLFIDMVSNKKKGLAAAAFVSLEMQLVNYAIKSVEQHFLSRNYFQQVARLREKINMAYHGGPVFQV